MNSMNAKPEDPLNRTASSSASPSVLSNSSKSDENCSSELDGFQQTSTHSSSNNNERQLNFAKLGLIGRETELRLLQTAINRVVKDASSAAAAAVRSLVLISGMSGSGKSTLAMHLQQDCLDKHAFFVSGKFDLQQMEEPYSGIKSAMIQLCHQIEGLTDTTSGGGSTGVTASVTGGVTSTSASHENDNDNDNDPRKLFALKELLSKGFGSAELQTLLRLVPNLSNIIEINNGSSRHHRTTAGTTSSNGSANSSNSNTIGNTIGNAAQHQRQTGRQIPSSSASNNDNDTATDTSTYREQSDRLTFVLRRFLQIICEFSPLVLVVDDLQWADQASLDLLHSWIVDPSLSRLIIVACYRSDSQNAAFRETIGCLKKKQQSLEVIPITLHDLTKESVQSMLQKLLLMPAESVSDLAEIVHRKTGGNVFFVQQFLQSLVRDYLLVYQQQPSAANSKTTSFQWHWNTEEIHRKSPATMNIVEYMRQKIVHTTTTASAAAKQILSIAASMGTTSFSRRTLIVVVRAMSIHSEHSAFLQKMLYKEGNAMLRLTENDLKVCCRICEREGFIESYQVASSRKGKLHYRFIHDKVQEAALSLISSEEVLSELQYRVGEVLLSAYSEEELDEKVFAVANLINSRMDLVLNKATDNNSAERRNRIAMLNYRAGRRAVNCSAFEPALRYFELAIQLLSPEDDDMLVEIYSSAAECAYVTSNLDEMNAYCQHIISNVNCTILEKVRAYHILIDVSLEEAQQHQHTESGGEKQTTNTLNLCFQVLEELGCRFPKSNVGRTLYTARGMLQMRRSISKWSVETFKNMPISTDPTEMAILKTLDKLATTAYLMSKDDIMPLAILKSIKRTMAHGAITPCSSPAFSFQGMITGYFMGDFQGGRKFGEIALEMQKVMRRMEEANPHMISSSCESKTIFMVHFGTWHWTNPLEDSLDAFMESYRIGMATGDVESAMWGMQTYLLTAFAAGMPLEPLSLEIRKYSKIMRDYRQYNQEQFIAMTWQVIHNILGQSEHRTLLVGNAFDEREVMSRPSSELDPIVVLSIAGNNAMAATYLGDYEVGARLAVQSLEERLKKFPGLSTMPTSVFYAGLCCFAMVNDGDTSTSKSRIAKYKKVALRCRQLLKTWSKKGNPNCLHSLAFLSGEYNVSRQQYDSAIQNYNESIEISRRRSIIHDQALANERLSLCFLKMGQPDDARAALEEAIRLNVEWGATKKVHFLEARYRDTWGSQEDRAHP